MRRLVLGLIAAVALVPTAVVAGAVCKTRPNHSCLANGAPCGGSFDPSACQTIYMIKHGHRDNSCACRPLHFHRRVP